MLIFAEMAVALFCIIPPLVAFFSLYEWAPFLATIAALFAILPIALYLYIHTQGMAKLNRTP